MEHRRESEMSGQLSVRTSATSDPGAVAFRSMEVSTPRGGSQYQPALDGVRAVAVGLVLLFHLGLSWMPAGYLGVSVFFTLSGYLITSLLLDELGSTGRIALGVFAARRARRLLPASLVCVGVVVLAIALGQFALVPDMRVSLVGATLQVSNWVALAGTSSYQNLFSTSPAFVSPLTHFWSLAIEGQFYVVWPIVLFGLWRLVRTRRSLLVPLVLALTALFGVAAVVIARVWGVDAAYWSTPARLGELLVGASLAAVLNRLRVVDRRWGAAAVVGLVGVLVCSTTFPSSGGPAFNGLLTPFAVLSAAVVLGVQVAGPVRTALSWRPLVAVGRVSYGIYLFHWPVFVLLRQHGWRLDKLPDATGALAITACCTMVSARFVEAPIRRARWRPVRVAVLSVSALAAALIAVAVVPVHRGFLEADSGVFRAAAIDTAVPAPLVTNTTVSVASTSDVSTSKASVDDAHPTVEITLPLPPVPSRPVRVLMVGDSTAFYVGQGLAQWAVAHPEHLAVGMRWCQGCGFILDGTITSFEGASFVERSRHVVEIDVPAAVRKLHPDVVVLMSTVDDVASRQWTAGEGVLTPRDSAFRQRMVAAYQRVTTSLLDLKVRHVVWVLPPVPTSRWSTPEMGEVDRYQIQHDVIREVAAASGAAVSVADMDGWMTRSGHADDSNWRPDGTHLDEQSALWLVERWFGPTLVSVALR